MDKNERYDSEQGLGARVTELCHYLGIKRKEFAQSINLSESGMSQLCSGKFGASDRTLDVICSTYGVSQEWLRYGTGDTFVQVQEDEKIARFCKEAMTDYMNPVKKIVLSALADLSDEDWNTIHKVVFSLYDKIDAEQTDPD